MTSPVELPRVRATDAATQAVAALARHHGPLVIVQSAGCCDGSAPMCIPAADFPLGADDIKVGDVADVPFYIARRELRAWTHHNLLLDVQPGYADGLSLSAGDGLHFVTLPDHCATLRADGRPSTKREPTSPRTVPR